MKKLTVRETAEKFGVTTTAVMNWMKDGLPFTREKIIGQKTRSVIDPDDVAAYHMNKAVR